MKETNNQNENENPKIIEEETKTIEETKTETVEETKTAESKDTNTTQGESAEKKPVIESITEFSTKSRFYTPKSYPRRNKENNYKYRSVKNTFYENGNDSDSNFSQRNDKKSNKNINAIRFYFSYITACLLFIYALVYLIRFDKIFEKGVLTIDIFYLLLLLFLLNIMLVLRLNSSCLIYLKEIFIEAIIVVYAYLLVKAVKDGILQREITGRIFCMQILTFFMSIVLYFKN